MDEMLDKSAKVYKKIVVNQTCEGQVLRIILSSPPGNVLDALMISELHDCLDEQAGDQSLKAIVIEGEGKHFCFGAKVEDHLKENASKMISGFHGIFKKLLACLTPTIALVRGQCLGGGMELATFCNFVIAEPGARFGQPEIQLGVFPPVAAAILPDLIGQSRADDLIISGRSLKAETAFSWGLVHAVEASAELALEKLLATAILTKSASSLRLANRVARWTWHRDLPTRLDEMERFYINELMETKDANEGIAAFLGKRPPIWKNR